MGGNGRPRIPRGNSLGDHQVAMQKALLKHAIKKPLVCKSCGGKIFVMHELVECITIEIPRLISGNLEKPSGAPDDIAFHLIQRIFMCPNPKCKNKVVGSINYGSALKEEKQAGPTGKVSSSKADQADAQGGRKE